MAKENSGLSINMPRMNSNGDKFQMDCGINISPRYRR